jgi:N-acetylglucosaminyl-diphospho-decaprenol L-rhamnosyltransferase
MRPIDVVIPVHNRWELTKSCLEHLRAQTQPHTVTICDNGSTDATVDQLRTSSPDVRVLELGANLGFSAACNRGVRAGDAEVVVLLNNDVDCRPDFLERLVAPLYGDEHLGSVAGLLVEPGEETIESYGLAVDPTLAGYPRLRGLPVSDAQTRDPVLLGPSGAAGAYRRTTWEEVGGLDEGVLAYSEDVDLALRLRAAGWSTTGATDAIAVHVGSASAGPRSAWQRYQAGFARGYFLRRYGVLRGRHAVRAGATEAMVVVADAALFSRDLAAFRGRLAGWRKARGLNRRVCPPRDAVETRITFRDSLRLRFGLFTGRH